MVSFCSGWLVLLLRFNDSGCWTSPCGKIPRACWNPWASWNQSLLGGPESTFNVSSGTGVQGLHMTLGLPQGSIFHIREEWGSQCPQKERCSSSPQITWETIPCISGLWFGWLHPDCVLVGLCKVSGRGGIVSSGLCSVLCPGQASVPHPVLTLWARAGALFCRLRHFRE